MRKLEVESLSDATNGAVVRLPGRQFPGIVIQGDSLKILVDSVEDLKRLSRHPTAPELEDAVAELSQILTSYKQAYEQAVQAQGERLPY